MLITVVNCGKVDIKGTLKSFIISVSPFERCFFSKLSLLRGKGGLTEKGK